MKITLNCQYTIHSSKVKRNYFFSPLLLYFVFRNKMKHSEKKHNFNIVKTKKVFASDLNQQKTIGLNGFVLSGQPHIAILIT